MIKHNQYGSINVLLVPLILAIVMLIGAATFGFWAFGERQNYKNNVDDIVSKAVKAGRADEAVKKDAEFIEIQKNPLQPYNGPEQYGSISVQYPKSWSASSSSANGVNVYFHPDIVPATGPFALRVEVSPRSFAEEAKRYESKKGVTGTAYSFPKVSGVVGVKVDGEISDGLNGSMILMPIRDKTLKVYTESQTYISDFNTYILPNVTFVP